MELKKAETDYWKNIIREYEERNKELVQKKQMLQDRLNTKYTKLNNIGEHQERKKENSKAIFNKVTQIQKEIKQRMDQSEIEVGKIKSNRLLLQLLDLNESLQKSRMEFQKTLDDLI